MDASLALLFAYYKKFDHFQPVLLHKRARLLHKGDQIYTFTM